MKAEKREGFSFADLRQDRKIRREESQQRRLQRQRETVLREEIHLQALRGACVAVQGEPEFELRERLIRRLHRDERGFFLDDSQPGRILLGRRRVSS